jgi:beta-glucanase (GH16 family)
MNSRGILLLAILALLASFLPVYPVSADSWNLVWSDEFNGSSLDPANWAYDIGNGTAGWGNSELQYYTNRMENVQVKNGELIITARKEKDNGFDYTSGRIKTKDKQSWTYGRIEARIKLPSGIGLWPAFWMMGADIDGVGWPKCGEIDIMEHINMVPYVNGTMHWDNNGHQQYGLTTDADLSKYHVYAVEWDPGSIRWFIDGKKYCEGDIREGINGTEEFHEPFFLLLNLAVGGRWPGSPGAGTVFPASMRVDYVRVYSGSVKWYLTHASVSGVSPMGQVLQTDKHPVAGWKPTGPVVETPACWYTPAGSYQYKPGTWSLTLWTDNPGAASKVKVELFRTDSAGGRAKRIGACTRDIAATGAGNHPTTFSFSTSTATSLSNQRLLLKISLDSGKSCTMTYNTRDSGAALTTP